MNKIARLMVVISSIFCLQVLGLGMAEAENKDIGKLSDFFNQLVSGKHHFHGLKSYWNHPKPAQLVKGRVESQGVPLNGLTVSLYQVRNGISRYIDTTMTNSKGEFGFPRNKIKKNVQHYLIASGGSNSPVALMAIIDDVKNSQPRAYKQTSRKDIIVNELTTVAAAWVTAPFLDGVDISGNTTGVSNAMTNAGNLINPYTGNVAERVVDAVNIQTTTLSTLYSLGNILGNCVIYHQCNELFLLATPTQGITPTNTLEAALNIARNPWQNINEIFELLPIQQDAFYKPILRYAPTAWTLSLIYTGGGIDAPGGISVDADGFIWTNNNFLAGSQSFLQQKGFGGLGVTKFTPNGIPLSPPFGFQGGGINGAGFGLAIDQRGHIWVGNFAGNSVSELNANAKPVSPATGYTLDNTTNRVQATVVDQQGNIWAANFDGNSVSFFPSGNPTNGKTFMQSDYPKCQFNQPFGIAIDHDGNPWVANLGGGTIVRVVRGTADLCPDGAIDIGAGAQGIAVDSQGNLWVTHFGQPSVSLYRPLTGEKTSYNADGSLVGGWGIAIDGRDNVWVADFWGTRVVQLCGVAEDCPKPDQVVGDPISSSTGYGGAGGMQFITSVVIDPSGNVLVANNQNNQLLCDTSIPLDQPTTVKLEQASMQCGGNGVLAFYGLAAPVKTPLIGPPAQPN